MSLLLSYEPENHLDAPLFGTVALSETYEEVVDAACDMWSNYLPPHNRVNGRHLAQQFKQPDGRVVWARISKSLFPSIVRNAPPDGFQLQLQIDKSLVGSYDSRPEFSSPTMLDTSLPALSSGSDSINSREHFPADESESATNNLTRSPITPMTPITPGPSFEDDPVIEAPPYPKGLDTFPYEAAGTNMHFKEGLEAFLAGRYNDACAQFQLAADQFHETNNTRQEADCLVRLGMTCRHLKNYVVARSHLLAARALYERLGSNCRQEMFQCARHLARIEEDTGNLRAALNEYRLLKTATEQAGLRTQYAWCSYYLGHIYNRMKRYEDALGSLKDAVNVSREIGNAEVEAFATEDCGYTAERQGHAGLALGCYQEALKLFKNQGQGKWLENEARVKRRIAQLRGKPETAGSKKFSLGWTLKRQSSTRS